MRLSMVSRREVIVKSADKYRKASKKDKGQILDRITEITGYNRDYASHLLTLFGKRLYMESKRGTRFILEADRKDSKVRRKRKRTYDREVADAVATLWKMMDYICGKRLAAAIPWLVPKLEATKDLFLDDDRRLKVMSVSAATIDRMLADRKRKLRLKERSSTKPGTLLKHKIPIRTFADWDEDKPGFVEIDLVSHEGGCSSGEGSLHAGRNGRRVGVDRADGRQEQGEDLDHGGVEGYQESSPLPSLRDRFGQRFDLHKPPPAKVLRRRKDNLHKVKGREQERQLLRGAEELVSGKKGGRVCQVRYGR